ncbi:MAG: hypothetical protein R3F11_00335 [Verrucomicrobiales bacterium]
MGGQFASEVIAADPKTLKFSVSGQGAAGVMVDESPGVALKMFDRSGARSTALQSDIRDQTGWVSQWIISPPLTVLDSDNLPPPMFRKPVPPLNVSLIDQACCSTSTALPCGADESGADPGSQRSRFRPFRHRRSPFASGGVRQHAWERLPLGQGSRKSTRIRQRSPEDRGSEFAPGQHMTFNSVNQWRQFAAR